MVLFVRVHWLLQAVLSIQRPQASQAGVGAGTAGRALPSRGPTPASSEWGAVVSCEVTPAVSHMESLQFFQICCLFMMVVSFM